jgi:glycosyltransferase involved in cell wall biosynthesis
MTESGLIRSFQVGISWATEGAGGSGRVYADLSRYLPGAGVQFRGAVSAPANVGEQTGGAIQCFVPQGSGFGGKLRGARAAIAAEIAQRKPDLIASHFALFVAPALDLLKKQPHVVHFHGPWSAESAEEGAGKMSAALKHVVEGSVYRRGDRVIVLSRAFATVAEERYGVKPERIRMVPGAVDLERFGVAMSKAAAREALGWPADRRILVTVRRLVNRMGLGNLVDAMKQVVAREPHALLYIAGKGRLKAQLEAQIAAHGLADHVKLLGFVADAQLPLIYRAADINVVPTLSLEGFGLVAAEALAAGTPSMVTPVGGLPEVVSGLSTDLVFASSLPGDMAAGLMAVLAGSTGLPTERACRAYAQQQFSAELMAERTAAVYREVVSG